MDINNRFKLILIVIFFFFKLDIEANIIYDKNDVLISELDLNYFKQMHFEKYKEELNDATALKNLVIVKKVIKSLEKNNPYFLDKIDRGIDEEIGILNIKSETILDIIRYFKTRNEFIYDYFNNIFNIEDLKSVFKSFDNLRLPISDNNCLTIMKLIELSDNDEFVRVFFDGMKIQSSVYKISINDSEYNVCINQIKKEKIEREIFKYIDLVIQDNFNKFVYEQQKK